MTAGGLGGSPRLWDGTRMPPVALAHFFWLCPGAGEVASLQKGDRESRGNVGPKRHPGPGLLSGSWVGCRGSPNEGLGQAALPPSWALLTTSGRAWCPGGPDSAPRQVPWWPRDRDGLPKGKSGRAGP